MAYSKIVNAWSTLQEHNDPLVLIADDDPSIRLLLRHAMEKDGYKVVEVVNGAEAVKATEKYHPSLILMDAVMPVLDGFNATSTLMEIEEYSDIPVLMITALDDDRSVAKAFISGALDYITKPVNWSVLKHRVRRMLHAAEAERQIRHLAYLDSLTGLPNRLLFMDRLDQAISRAIRQKSIFALLFIDIDHFKVINDSMGHHAGDQLLTTVTSRLQQSVRQSDTIARLGGDEFTVIVENINQPEDVLVVTKTILSTLNEPVMIDNREVFISASIGVSVYPDDGDDLGSLLKNAETAMYKAKDHGRNNLQFYRSEMSDAAMRRLDMENSLRNAIERDELLVFYQPKFNLLTGKCLGMEALVRWDHPDRGLVLPDEFIPLAEETGMILQLDDWVIRTACKQLSVWKKAGYEVNNLAINVSARQFKEHRLVGVINKVLEETGVQGHELEIELTESTLVDNNENAREMLNELHEMGLRIALDDFGTGYASMSYLKDFPIDTVKIDRSFVWGIPNDKEDMAIVKAIVGLADALDLSLIAEGVETEQQIEFLNSIGCKSAQGYYWSKPVSALMYEQDILQAV
ncbi:MAG: EAL domain-containing protein [Gammaproteobacteria bacterium]